MRDYQLSIENYKDVLKVIPILLVCIMVVGLLCWLIPDLSMIIFFSSLITGFIVFVMVLIFRYNGRKTIDTFQITSEGIRTINHGLIKWDDISICSIENSRGFISVHIKMKDKSRYAIGFVGLKNFSVKADEDMHSFFNEIRDEYDKLPEESRFKLYENRINGFLQIVVIVMFFCIFVGMFLFRYFFE